MTIAYLVNQYPKVSHSFIRREIAGVEATGIRVVRFAIRSCAAELVDEEDKIELKKTRFILEVGAVGLLVSLLQVLVTKPVNFSKALWLAVKIGWHSDRGILLHLIYFAEACVLLGWCTRDSITHLHAHFGINPTAVAMLCRVLGGPPYSFTVHGPEEFDKATILALDEKIQRAAFVVAISSFGRSQLYRWCDRKNWSKIQIVHCGVDEIFFQEALTPVPEEPQLVCVGRLSEQKGHLLLIEAAGKLAAQGFQFKLVLVGDGPLRNQIETRIAQLKLEKHVEITGWASNAEVKQQLLASRALVLPSFAEGLPVVIMEALALGRPVLSTYVAGIPELVEPEVCGWLIPPGCPEALADAMGKILQLPVAKLQEMGKTGFERVAQRHNAIVEASKLAMLFQPNTEFPPSLSTVNTPQPLAISN
ncbi:MAG TPA: colanic acid biosynthesis glycosyltransferase WcaL [Cyanobacteria bacterium UBA11149]|nr:colanic acid biosynthesis glycosyltransferase WcaL [Cyanobacteria bacterium UBA11367]HBE57024.1 colanic acid biosynthesis glycosyltransferase WcaL [Cyanobacteria bacterium UBA11366]HBK66751.1 colanic acid biosynthesis glycosyltransferase WcaL [Cyanobacteria bacterium UBA11166]HBR73046.1 colanic acid biosynthesis glycosyltransferase WcaL [Cyanobacteria bacterium UBA11159]HBS72739.1 colanic acid biosynthesis glycosyltransferase WcaL [Cyanobacteria bacterium UBA11153]HBW88861.1 colanic acid bi